MSGDLVAASNRGRPRRVVVTFPLPEAARAELAAALGEGVLLIDVRDAAGDEDVVLLPSTSRQLISKIAAGFPDAEVVVVEVEDPAHGIDLGGHVTRSLDAGADGYYVARSIEQLAAVVDRTLASPPPTAEPLSAELAAPADEDELGAILDRLVQRQPATEPADRPDRP